MFSCLSQLVSKYMSVSKYRISLDRLPANSNIVILVDCMKIWIHLIQNGWQTSGVCAKVMRWDTAYAYRYTCAHTSMYSFFILRWASHSSWTLWWHFLLLCKIIAVNSLIYFQLLRIKQLLFLISSPSVLYWC